MFNKDIIVILILRLPLFSSSIFFKELFVGYLSVSDISLNANVSVIL